jgi:carotenoid 1,2-hydratase
VFSPYYAWALKRGPAPAEDHCALNVALYGPGCRRWTMTERGQRHIARDTTRFDIGPSAVRWDGQALVIDIVERAVPFGQRVSGQVRLHPECLFGSSWPLDDAGRHRWGPIAPTARVEVSMEQPALSWRGHAYFDSNEGDEPIERAFIEWDWSRSALADGSTAVLYDVRQKAARDRLLALRFDPATGAVAPFDAPPRHVLPRSVWRIGRSMRSEGGQAPAVVETLEDTPFYVRSVLSAGLCGERVTALHETLNVPRFASKAVRLMLPWRMPRVG